METLFDWPTPPYFAFAPGSEKTGPEACLIYLFNGNKALDNLIRISPDESSIVFQPTRSETNETIGLDQIKERAAGTDARPAAGSICARSARPGDISSFRAAGVHDEIRRQ